MRIKRITATADLADLIIEFYNYSIKCRSAQMRLHPKNFSKKLFIAGISGHQLCYGEVVGFFLKLKTKKMKKIFMTMLVAGSSCAVFAQEDSMRTTAGTMGDSTVITTDPSMNANGSMTTSSDYNAFSTYTAMPPEYMGSYVLRDYPGATDVKWRQENDWWHGYYVTGGTPSHMYYNTAGQTFTVALPVRQSYVPETVVTKAVEMYGPVLYDISTIKGSNKEDVYAVRIIENGQLSTVWIGEDGNRVMDVYRIETSSDNAAMDNQSMQTGVTTDGTITTDAGTNMNTTTEGNTKTKIKTKNSDGTETKTKIKSGTVKTKTY